jgi:hypothetical protein
MERALVASKEGRMATSHPIRRRRLAVSLGLFFAALFVPEAALALVVGEVGRTQGVCRGTLAGKTSALEPGTLIFDNETVATDDGARLELSFVDVQC